MSTVVVNVNGILAAFDEDESVSPDANAIKTVAGEEFMFALLIEYFRREGIEANRLKGVCTTGKSSGPRLDGWVEIQTGTEQICYQVEVKLWSAHGVGSGAHFLKPGADIAAYRRKLWSTYWLDGKFKEAGLNKVLTPMQCPMKNATVRPLACLWSPLHPSGCDEPFFEHPLQPPQRFPSVWIFSASSFLRRIKEQTPDLRLALPEFGRRMRWLKTLFVLHAAQQTHPGDVRNARA